MNRSGNRSGRWRSREPGGSRVTARPGRLATGATISRADPVLHPDPRSSLSDGVVVQTRLVAWLLGLRLLRIDGTVLLSPGRLDGDPGAVPGRTVVPSYGQPRAARPATGPTVAPSAPAGGELARARQLLSESDRRLRRLR